MIKFESNNILVGFIKNLLTEFKLPTPKVYNYDTDSYAVENQLYIKDGYICQYSKGEFKDIEVFSLDSLNKNYYKQLRFTGNSYDSHTHEYLGEYLRFLRDYEGLNLMSLYNCYSNSFPENLTYSFTQTKKKKKNPLVEDSTTIDNTVTVDIDSENPAYKIIMIPVKPDREYTVAIDCSLAYDLFCGFYDRALIQKKNFIETTYKKVGSSSFSSPYLYTKLTKENLGNDLYKVAVENENCLKLFIRLPATNQSSIVVLEGSYLNCNDWSLGNFTKTKKQDIFKAEYNYSILNANPVDINAKDADYANLIKTRNSLLEMNTGYSYPFANRLIEYLVNNVIDCTETIPDNIKRMQWLLVERYLNGKKTSGISSIGKAYGIWQNTYIPVLYNLAQEEGLLNSKEDILGYVDKDIESKLGRYADIKEKEGV